jgi:hypothetical protein
MSSLAATISADGGGQKVVEEGVEVVMNFGLLFGGVISLIGFAGGSSPKPTATFAVTGVLLDDARANGQNTHVVGTWALDIDLPPDSNTAQVQRAAQAECAKTAPKGLRCAEMAQWKLERDNRRAKPCAAVVLGLYRGLHDGVSRPYTLWSSTQGFSTKAEAERWTDAELQRMSAENDRDPLIRKISMSSTCAGPAA